MGHASTGPSKSAHVRKTNTTKNASGNYNNKKDKTPLVSMQEEEKKGGSKVYRQELKTKPDDPDRGGTEPLVHVRSTF